MIIHVLTSNEGKFKEMSRMLADLGHSAVKEDIDYPEIQTETLKEVVESGILWILDNEHRPWMDDPDHGFIIDDSGIFINALKGFPGVYSKYAFHTIGLNGILRLMQEIDDRGDEVEENGTEFEGRGAEFKTALMFAQGSRRHYFEGVCKGHLIAEMRGDQGFGYDPIFIPIGSGETFAEMTTKEKNAYSHRGKAMDQFLDFLRSLE